MKSASFACQGVHVVGNHTHNWFLPQTCKHLVHFTEPTLRRQRSRVRTESVGKVVARTHQRCWCPDHNDHSLARLSTFMTRIAAQWYTIHPVLVPRIAAWPHGVRPSSLRRGHEVLSVGKQNQGVLPCAKRSAWVPAWTSDLGTVCLGPGRPPPLPNTKDGANTSVKSRTATPAAATEHGVT